MTVTTSSTVKYYRFMLQVQWAAALNFPVKWQWSLTFLSLMSFSCIQNVLLDRNCSSSSVMITFLLKCFYITFLKYSLFKNCFNKFISSIFTSVKNNWFTKSIINKNNFVSKTTRNVILIFFWARTFITFNII